MIHSSVLATRRGRPQRRCATFQAGHRSDDRDERGAHGDEDEAPAPGVGHDAGRSCVGHRGRRGCGRNCGGTRHDGGSGRWKISERVGETVRNGFVLVVRYGIVLFVEVKTSTPKFTDQRHMSQATSENPRIARERHVVGSASDLRRGRPWAVTVDAVVARSDVARSDDLPALGIATSSSSRSSPRARPEIGSPAPEPAVDALRSRAASPRCCAILTAARYRCCSCSSYSSRVRPTSRKSSRPTSSRSSRTCSRGVREGVLRDGIDPHLVAALLFGPMLFAHLTTWCR